MNHLFLFSFSSSLHIMHFKDLNTKNKFATFPKLKLSVRRCSRIVLGDNEDNTIRPNEPVMRPKGAEFILNSSLPCQEINIGDPNVRYVCLSVCVFFFLFLLYQIKKNIVRQFELNRQLYAEIVTYIKRSIYI